MIQPLRPDWPDLPAGVRALSTVRGGGVSPGGWDDGAGGGGLNLGMNSGDTPENVAANRQLLRALLPAEPAWLRQVHGTRVVDAAQIQGTPEADASFTNQPGVVCAILTADCMPVLFADRAGRVVGAAHAGWRGLAGGVLEATLAAMRGAGASDIMAWMGPAIGPQQFEVGEDVFAAFTAQDDKAVDAFQVRPQQPGKYLCDLYALAQQRLQGLGVAVSGGGRCTVKEDKFFYSYRRKRVTGRMASLIWFQKD
jgi:YfiH family protein